MFCLLTDQAALKNKLEKHKQNCVIEGTCQTCLLDIKEVSTLSVSVCLCLSLSLSVSLFLFLEWLWEGKICFDIDADIGPMSSLRLIAALNYHQFGRSGPRPPLTINILPTYLCHYSQRMPFSPLFCNTNKLESAPTPSYPFRYLPLDNFTYVYCSCSIHED